jgi:beta-N-acetylhexosaminidase
MVLVRRRLAPRLLGISAALVAVAGATMLTAPAPARSAPLTPLVVSATGSPRSVASAAYDRMSKRQRIGQLFMAAVPSSGVTQAQIAMLANNDIDDVILDGDTTDSRHAVHQETHAIVSGVRFAHVLPFVSTDQEGGEVQRLSGSGFSHMPTALKQGQQSPSELKKHATHWGSQLLKAGVDLNLAPVADTVPKKNAQDNAPIGAFHREYGHSPKPVAKHVKAFVHGMNAADVATTVKHFPGLGRATGNTDTTPGVTDPTTRHDSYLKPFHAGINAGTQFVMVSSATYPSIDPDHIAAFSKTIIGSMLRGDASFTGVVISDDLGTSALAAVPVKKRALHFFNAGGTMLLDTSTGQIPHMIKAVLNKKANNAGFSATLKQDVMTVLLAKAKAGLIPS